MVEGALQRVMGGAAARRGAPIIIGALVVAAIIAAAVPASMLGAGKPVALYQQPNFWYMPPGAQMLSGPIMPPNFESWGASRDTEAQPVLAPSMHEARRHAAADLPARPKRAVDAPMPRHAMSLPSLPPLPQRMARKHGEVSDASASKVVSGEVHKLLSSAEILRMRASKMQAEARRRTTEAAEAEAVDRYLSHAQEELAAYGSNIKKLIDTSSSPARLHAQLKTFPKEAAELHALVDHSMSEADAAAVRITRAATQPEEAHAKVEPVVVHAKAPSGSKTAQSKHAQHRSFMAKGGQVLHAAATAKKDEAEAQGVEAVMKKLRAVKSFEKAHEAAHQATKARVPVAKKSRTQKLVQPSPLIGAVNVRNGEEIEGEPFLKYNATDVGLEEEGEEGIGKAAVVEEVEPHAYLCNETCKDAILDSVIGLSVKVAQHCIPDCAKGDYIMKTKGHPLPAWTTIDELKEQDEECTPDEEYQKCKLEALRPACNKVGDFIPNYCLVHVHEGICQQCSMLQQFAEEKGLEFDLEEDEGGCDEDDEDCDEEEDGEEEESEE